MNPGGRLLYKLTKVDAAVSILGAQEENMTTLNVQTIKTAMGEKGLSQADLARELHVSKESVSKWLRGEATPRPAKALKMALRLGLSRAQLLLDAPSNPYEPQVAFRMVRARSARDEHFNRAADMGRLLEALVQQLPFDKLKTPPTLKNPTADYDYLQTVVGALRAEIGASDVGAINIPALASLFSKLQAVIVPVLWGHRKQHENAIHIFLPRSSTTWVYLNLDTRLCDLKFWLAHELGHTYTFSSLRGEEGENFADRFAGALLLPEAAAKPLYEELSKLAHLPSRVKRISAVADELQISIVGIAKELDRYAQARGLPELIRDAKALYHASEMSKPPLASKVFFGEGPVDLAKLIELTGTVFHSPFFDALQAFLREHGTSASYVQSLLDCSLLDAKEICSKLA